MVKVIDKLDPTDQEKIPMLLSHIVQELNNINDKINSVDGSLINISNKVDESFASLEHRLRDLEEFKSKIETAKQIKEPFMKNWWQYGKLVTAILAICFAAGIAYQKYINTEPMQQLQDLKGKIELLTEIQKKSMH